MNSMWWGILRWSSPRASSMRRRHPACFTWTPCPGESSSRLGTILKAEQTFGSWQRPFSSLGFHPIYTLKKVICFAQLDIKGARKWLKKNPSLQIMLRFWMTERGFIPEVFLIFKCWWNFLENYFTSQDMFLTMFLDQERCYGHFAVTTKRVLCL